MTVQSSFRINQPPGSLYANWDRARRDIVLGAVECEALNKSEISYKWEMFSVPFGVSVTINDSTLHTCNFVLATRGGYLIRLTVNDGLINESITTLYIGIPLPNTGLCLPVANETNQDNSQIPYTGDRGWSDKLEAFCRAVDVNIVGQAIGKLKQIVETIAPTSNEVGEIDLGLSEGVIFQVLASVTGVSDDCDVEFAAAAYGSPDNQYEIGSREVEEFDVIKNISESVAALSNVVGYVDINLSEGMVFKVTGAVTGSSDDCNIEFSASAYGSPTNLYEVGQDSEGITLWNPSVDGNWEDRNAWGFDGLTAGRLYYRLSNNDVNPITIDVQIKIVGNVVSALTEPAWNPDVDGVWDDRGAWGFTGLIDGKLYYRVTNNGINSIVMTVQIKAVGFENALV